MRMKAMAAMEVPMMMADLEDEEEEEERGLLGD